MVSGLPSKRLCRAAWSAGLGNVESRVSYFFCSSSVQSKSGTSSCGYWDRVISLAKVMEHALNWLEAESFAGAEVGCILVKESPCMNKTLQPPRSEGSTP